MKQFTEGVMMAVFIQRKKQSLQSHSQRLVGIVCQKKMMVIPPLIGNPYNGYI